MSHWKKKSELAKVLQRYELSQRRLRNLRRACRNSGWTVEAIRAIEACRAGGVVVLDPDVEIERRAVAR